MKKIRLAEDLAKRDVDICASQETKTTSLDEWISDNNKNS